MMEQIIRHKAVVKSVEHQRVRVTIVQSSACSSCAAHQLCNSAESKEKDVDVFVASAQQFRVGQEVVLEGRLSDGRAAALIAYGAPLVLLLLTLFVCIGITNDETQSALWSLLAVVLYYVVVFLFFRRKLEHRFEFKIKQNDITN
ncbi:MAG: SoxR reducing system RseC family protein [Bacteroidaceae bacterium]|nr:SoxR reducing system RseC family protein [Bacteroidaceae bacterium]